MYFMSVSFSLTSLCKRSLCADLAPTGRRPGAELLQNAQRIAIHFNVEKS
jgi:hypothetical protein